RLPLRIRLPERVVSAESAQSWDVAAPVGAEGRDDVVGAAVVKGLRVPGDRGADSLGDLGVRAHLACLSMEGVGRERADPTSNLISATCRSSGFTLTSRSAGRSCS